MKSVIIRDERKKEKKCAWEWFDSLKLWSTTCPGQDCSYVSPYKGPYFIYCPYCRQEIKVKNKP